MHPFDSFFSVVHVHVINILNLKVQHNFCPHQILKLYEKLEVTLGETSFMCLCVLHTISTVLQCQVSCIL